MTSIHYCQIGLGQADFILLKGQVDRVEVIPGLEGISGIILNLPENSIRQFSIKNNQSNSFDKIDLDSFIIDFFKDHIAQWLVTKQFELNNKNLLTINIRELSDSEIQFMRFKQKFQALEHVNFHHLTEEIREMVHFLMRGSSVMVREISGH